MAKADDIARDFKALYRNIENSAVIAVNKAAQTTRQFLKAASPVKTGRYQRSWRLSRTKSTPDMFASAAVFNPIDYGYWIEEGVEDPNKEPFWGRGTKSSPEPGPKTWVGSFFGSKKHIWSSTAPGGVVRPFMDAYKGDGSKVLDALARDIIKGIKW